MITDNSTFINIAIVRWPSYDHARRVNNISFGLGLISLWLHQNLVKVTVETLGLVSHLVS